MTRLHLLPRKFWKNGSVDNSFEMRCKEVYLRMIRYILFDRCVQSIHLRGLPVYFALPMIT